MALQLRTGPASEPVSLADTKSFLRIDGADDDILVSSLITAARIYIETTTAKILLLQNWSLFKDKWPSSGVLHLPLSPVQSIDEVRLYNLDESHSVLDVSEYAKDLISTQPRIKLLSQHLSQSPSAPLNHIEVQFTAGFGAAESDVPADLRQALLMLAAHWYEQREPVGFGSSFNEIPLSISAVLEKYKAFKVQ